MDQATQLHAIAPAAQLAETVTVTSTQVDPKDATRRLTQQITHTITPFTYRALFKVLAHINRIYSVIEDQELDINDGTKLFKLVMHAMGHAGDDVQALVALALGRQVEYLDTVMPDDGIRLTMAVIRVNKDFFVERILPMMAGMRAEIQEAINPVGETS